MILIICRQVLPLRLVVSRYPSCCQCGVLCMPTCWFSASCWVNEDWLTLHLAHCSLPGPGIGELFVGSSWRCRPVKDISPGPLSTICLPPVLRQAITSALQLCGPSSVWKDDVQSTTWGLKSYKFELVIYSLPVKSGLIFLAENHRLTFNKCHRLLVQNGDALQIKCSDSIKRLHSVAFKIIEKATLD